MRYWEQPKQLVPAFSVEDHRNPVARSPAEQGEGEREHRSPGGELPGVLVLERRRQRGGASNRQHVAPEIEGLRDDLDERRLVDVCVVRMHE